MGTIYIDGLRVFANHGVFEFENQQGQNFYIRCKMDLRVALLAAQSDDIENTVSYAEVCSFIDKYMKNHTFHLIETVGDSLAKEILQNFPGIQSITLRVDKPEAPIDLEFESVAYETTLTWTEVVVAVGSNMGDKKAYITDAVNALKSNLGIRLIAESQLLVTEPYGGVEQDEFLNGCLLLETYYSPQELLDVLHEIEQAAHRTREVHWGPRTLDLDIIFYGDRVIHTKDLIIPHIDMQNREFVLKPLCEIAPYAYHSILHKTASQLLEELLNK